MYTRIFAVLSAVVIETSFAIKGFAPIDYEQFALPPNQPIQLVNKVFSDDGFDPAADIITEGNLDSKKFAEGKAAMDKEFTQIVDRARHEGPMKLSDLKNFAPHIKKLDISHSSQ